MSVREEGISQSVAALTNNTQTIWWCRFHILGIYLESADLCLNIHHCWIVGDIFCSPSGKNLLHLKYATQKVLNCISRTFFSYSQRQGLYVGSSRPVLFRSFSGCCLLKGRVEVFVIWRRWLLSVVYMALKHPSLWVLLTVVRLRKKSLWVQGSVIWVTFNSKSPCFYIFILSWMVLMSYIQLNLGKNRNDNNSIKHNFLASS